jgi:nucleotide-binding universal stress UspA family protein
MNSKKKNRILVCIDFHEQSLIALHQCYDLARFINAEIVILYVIESNDFFSGFFTQNIEKAKEEVESRLKQLVIDLTEESGLAFSYSIEIGKTYERIVCKAQEIKARFIVMGKNGANRGIKRYLGSNTIHVISESRCPVISVKGEHTIGYKTIVLPLDLTQETREKVASAIAFSRYFGSHIHVVSVLTGGVLMQKSRIYRKMKRVQFELESNGVTSTLKLFSKTKDDDWVQVLRYSNEINADLIMLMTHQEARISDYYIGAFAHHIINESEIPVLTTIPSRGKEGEETYVESIVDPFNIF